MLRRVDDVSENFILFITSEDLLDEKTWKNYASEVDTTDAQAWITPGRWKFILKGVGKWSPTHDSLFAKMKNEVPNYTTLKYRIYDSRNSSAK